MAAPLLDSSTLPLTPAHEWANDTAYALSSKAKVVSEDEAFASRPLDVSTPGKELPGAFPKNFEHETTPDPLPSAEQIMDVGAKVIDTARAYLPAQEDVEKVIEIAKAYLPQAVQSYLPTTTADTTQAHTTSLLSREAQGDTSRKSDGVGALPGRIDEPSVAKLLDERSSQEKQALEPQHPIVTTTNKLQETESHQSSETTLSAHPVTAKDDEIVDTQPHEHNGSPVHSLPPAPIRESSDIDAGHSESNMSTFRVSGARVDEPPTTTNPSQPQC